MVITHIAKLQNRIFSGVDVVVPQHVITQQEFADVCLLNLHNTDIQGIKHYFKYCHTRFSELPAPYNKPDLVVFHEAYNVENIGIYKILLRKKIPYVIVPHGELSSVAQKRKWLKKRIANLLLFRHFIENAAAVQCLSESERNATCFRVSTFIGTNGVHLPSKGKEEFRKDSLKFVYIGRLDTYVKGLDLLIAAVAKEKELLRKRNCSLYMYGPDDQGDYSNLTQLVSKMDIADIIHLSHAVTGLEKANVLLDADVFIQTSRTEGMPMGILEALSYGLPCLVAEGTRVKNDVVSADAGWGCENTVESIAEAIKKAVEGKCRLKQKSENAQILIKEKYIWSKVSKDTIEVYKQITR